MSEINYTTLEAERFKSVGRHSQKIDEFEIDYVLDKTLLELKETGKTNVNDKIQSYAECALDKILDQYLDNDNDISNIEFDVDTEPVNGSGLNDKLEDQLNASMYFDELKNKYDLDPMLSNEDVIKYITSYKDKYDKILNAYKEDQNAKKEIKQESKQEEL